MGIGTGQLIIILLIVLLLFGAGKLPKVMADLGKGLKAFKNAMHEEEPKQPDDAGPKQLKDE